jgi:hypothetical protein
LLLFVWPLFSAQAAPLPVPGHEEHGAFLYGDWKPNRPSAVVFLDPLCPYCKRAIPRLGMIERYNLFVFWAPIFGDRSETIVAPLFQCARPTSKILLDGIARDPRAAPAECSRHDDAALRTRNDAMVAAYDVNAVPAFYLQGKQTNLTVLQQAPANRLPARIQGVALPWQRYAPAQRLAPSDYGSAAILIAAETPAATAQAAVARYNPQYVFSPDRWELLCQESLVKGCPKVQQLPGLFREVSALLGVAPGPAQAFVITFEGSIEETPL